MFYKTFRQTARDVDRKCIPKNFGRALPADYVLAGAIFYFDRDGKYGAGAESVSLTGR